MYKNISAKVQHSVDALVRITNTLRRNNTFWKEGDKMQLNGTQILLKCLNDQVQPIPLLV